MNKQKTAIAQAIEKIKEVQSEMTSSSQKLGLAIAMDVLEDFKEVEKEQIRKSFNQGHTWASEMPIE